MKRIFHTWDKWECYPVGFYENHPPNKMTNEEAEKAYCTFLSDLELFGNTMCKVITEWKYSCEHYLTNPKMNRIAWMGQAAMCLHSGIPSRFRGGYNILSDEQKQQADELALKYINIWFKRNDYSELNMTEIQSLTDANIY